MVSVVAGFTIKDGKADECLGYVKKLVAETLKEKGCIMYECCCGIDNPLKCVILEKWESKEILDAHMETAHFKEYIPKMDPLTNGITVDVFNVI